MDANDRRIKQLERTVSALVMANADLRTENSQLRLDKSQLQARLRVVELMEEQAANRLGFQIPLRLIEEAHSLKAVEQ